MAMFNLNKSAAKGNSTRHYDEMLRDNNEEHGLTPPDKGIWERQLEDNGHKDDDAESHTERRLADVHTGSESKLVEGRMNDGENLYNLHRSRKARQHPLVPTNLLEEATHQKKVEAFKAQEKTIDTDTSFWDKYLHAQIDEDRITKIKGNTQPSQLHNHPDRFGKLDDTVPVETDQKINRGRLRRNDKVDEMVMASLKDADAMLFHLHLTAAQEGRELNKDEQQIAIDINASKSEMLTTAAFDGDADEKI